MCWAGCICNVAVWQVQISGCVQAVKSFDLVFLGVTTVWQRVAPGWREASSSQAHMTEAKV